MKNCQTLIIYITVLIAMVTYVGIKLNYLIKRIKGEDDETKN